MGPLTNVLEDQGVFEVVVNRPGEMWVENAGGWRKEAAAVLDLKRLEALARAIASYSGDVVDGERPILSATLPTGERIQVVRSPAVVDGLISLTIRKPSGATYSLDQLDDKGLFSQVRSRAQAASAGQDDDLLDSLAAGDIRGFLRKAVIARKNIIISGATGSGKTTLSK